MNTMRPWRVLRAGMREAPDVMAAQRGLWRMLDADAQNTRSGTYGEGTQHDVALARRRLHLPGRTTEIGADLWTALQDSFDAAAWTLASRKPSAVKRATPTCKRLPLSKGMRGADVQAAQRALWRALAAESRNGRTGTYGDQTVADVAAFRRRYGVNPDDPGKSIGLELWNVLTRWMDDGAVSLARQAPPPPPPVPAKLPGWQDVADAAWWGYQNRGRFKYAQVRPMAQLHDPPLVYTDCSGFYTACCQAAGVPNPNRSDGVYDRYGYTGTLQSHGRWTRTPRPGDVALYGAGGVSTHAAVYLGDGTVVSFGHDPIEHLPARYRSDFMGFRTYH